MQVGQNTCIIVLTFGTMSNDRTRHAPMWHESHTNKISMRCQSQIGTSKHKYSPDKENPS